MERKTLEDFLSKSNLSLLANFKMGVQGQNDFGQFMNLVRQEHKELSQFLEYCLEYKKEIEELNGKYIGLQEYDFQLEKENKELKREIERLKKGELL